MEGLGLLLCGDFGFRIGSCGIRWGIFCCGVIRVWLLGFICWEVKGEE